MTEVPSSRQQRAHEKEVEKSYQAWLRHLEKGHFSLAPELGKLAIVASLGTVENSKLSFQRQRDVFMEEGESLQGKYIREGDYEDVELYQAHDARVIREVLRDREVSGVVLVGHGGAGHITLPHGEFFGWQDVASENVRRGGHLKLGDFVQRTCGHIPPSGLTVPLPTFAVADQRKIRMPLGEAIPDEHPDDNSFRQIYDKPRNTPDDIRRVIDDARRR